MRTTLLAFPITVFFAVTAPSSAHELWLEAENYQISQNEEIVSDIKVGQNFIGSTYAYFPNNFQRLDIAVADMTVPIDGRLGDKPAIMTPPLASGLNILVYQSNVQTVFYSEWEKFVSFVEHKNFTGALEQHALRQIPQTEFREAYSRFAKSLIAIDGGEGQDRRFGLETEIVALENPYIDDISNGIRFQVHYREMTRPDTQIEVFEKAAGSDVEANVFTVRTNDRGVAVVPVKPGHVYQLDAVVLREPSEDLAESKNVVWESLWANLTFAVPGN